MFPIGIPPPGADPHGDDRGLDTINRLLLHGARHHDRAAVFSPGAAEPNALLDRVGAGDVPDWQADRLSIRIALVLHQELSLRQGDRVALWMPLSLAWPLVERGIWGLGAESVPIGPEAGASDVSLVLARTGPRVLFVSSASAASVLSIPGSVAAVVTLDDSAKEGFGVSLRELVDRGGVLDTPERASRFRETARRVPADAVASIELDSAGTRVETTQGGWARDAERFARRIPPRRGARHVLAWSGVEGAPRVVLYSGWADGLTTVALAGKDEDAIATNAEGEIVFSGRVATGSPATHFANLFQVTDEEIGGAP
jgi:acyl-CoA synthetase (AMP-forming)/AMP-acid ligase II